jgi:hypothetical protein
MTDGRLLTGTNRRQTVALRVTLYKSGGWLTSRADISEARL